METHPVRLATPEDATLLAELAARTFRDTFATDNSPENMAAYVAAHYSPAIQEQELRDPRRCCLLAHVGGAPAGFAYLRDEPVEPGVPGQRPLRLERLYVDRPFLNMRVGALLMRRCLEEAHTRGHDVMWLGVWEHNLRARAFYARWGFSEVGATTFALGDDLQSDLLLARPVAPPPAGG